MPYKRGKKWVGEVMRAGLRKSKKFLSKNEAQHWESEQKHVSLGDWLRPIPTEYSIAEWSGDYLDYAKKFSRKTYSEKRLAFRKFFESEIDPMLPVTAITSDKMLSHFQKQFDARSGCASNKDRKNMISAWNWGAKYKGLTGINSFLTDKFPEKRSPRYTPPESDFWKIFEAAEGQDKTLLLTYLHTAARRSEIFRLRLEDIDFGEEQVRLWTRKREGGTMEFDWVPMTVTLAQALLSHLNQNQITDIVFPNPDTGKFYVERKHFMEGLCKRAGVKEFGIHGIRHLSASILAKEGVPLPIIQLILRHRKITTTQRYFHGLGLKEELRRVMDRKAKQKVKSIYVKFTSGQKPKKDKLKLVNQNA